jgi:hypothetical protein
MDNSVSEEPAVFFLNTDESFPPWKFNLVAEPEQLLSKPNVNSSVLRVSIIRLSPLSGRKGGKTYLGFYGVSTYSHRYFVGKMK